MKSAVFGRLARLLIALTTVAAGGLLCARGASAQPSAGTGSSLDLIPADAAFYSASLRHKEQIEIIANSKAWARLTAMPTVQMGWQAAQAQLQQAGGPWEQVQAFFAVAENKELLDLGIAMVSHALFVYGDQRWDDSFDVIQQVFNGMRYGGVVEVIKKSQKASEAAGEAETSSDDAEDA